MYCFQSYVNGWFCDQEINRYCQVKALQSALWNKVLHKRTWWIWGKTPFHRYVRCVCGCFCSKLFECEKHYATRYSSEPAFSSAKHNSLVHLISGDIRMCPKGTLAQKGSLCPCIDGRSSKFNTDCIRILYIIM